VRATSRRLGTQTDASYRFERGVDSAAIAEAQALALRLLVQLAGARAAAEIVDVYPAPAQPRELTLSMREVARLLGFEPQSEEIVSALEALGLAPVAEAGGTLRTRIPSWRPDLEREADLVEEVARHIGYDRIPVAPVAAMAESDGVSHDGVERRSRDVLARSGFHEAIGYSMIADGEDDPFVAEGTAAALALSNPIAEPLAKLRRSVLPGLLRAADLNHRRGNRDVRLFEVGRVFLPREHGQPPVEPPYVGLVWSGGSSPRHWSVPTRDVDLFDLAGVVEHLLGSIAPGLTLECRPGGPAALHPGESATWYDAAGRAVAWGGALHPEMQLSFDVAALVAEVDLSAVADLSRSPAQYRGISRFPAVARDLSLVVGNDVTFGRLLEVLRSVDPPAPVDFAAIDRYEGPPLGDSEFALTVRFTIRPADRTLTDEETERYRSAVLERLSGDLAVEIRSESKENRPPETQIP
jgi:phenylalanyl-tRNA synthetase beta chain